MSQPAARSVGLTRHMARRCSPLGNRRAAIFTLRRHRSTTSQLPNVQDAATTTTTTTTTSLGEMPGTNLISMWSTSYAGVGSAPFDSTISSILQAPLPLSCIEIQNDSLGLLYLPDIHYRRILNQAFGPGGWGLVPRGPHSIHERVLSRDYALICHGRFVSVARGEQEIVGGDAGLAAATEGVKSNALLRCCKDLGVASELWDPAFVNKFRREHCMLAIVEHATKTTKSRRWRLKQRPFQYPYKEVSNL
ncbi:mitochondrial genome maintenance MGM101 [Ramicandelaber brevisporus]|nr:mitochondrial genome maintenance MGM101 [Ramicandelaber brevisporus]